MSTPVGPADIVALYDRVAAHSPLPIAMLAGRAQLLCGATPVFCQLFGAESPALLGRPFVDILPASDRERVLSLLDWIYQTGETGFGGIPQPSRLERGESAWHYVAWPIPDAQGAPVGVVVLIRDEQAEIDARAINEQLLISGLREQSLAEQLQRQLAFTSAITHSLDDGLCALDCVGRFTMVNPAAERMLGWSEGELLGMGAHEVVRGQVATSARRLAEGSPLHAVMYAGTVVRDDHALWTRRDGTVLPIAYSAAPIITDGQIVGAVVVFRDTTEAQQVMLTLAQQATELAHSRAKLEGLLADVQALALTDELTGLANRRGFLALAAQQLKVARRTQYALSLIFIDLDDFKAINDRLGHAVGDHALITMAQILTAVFRDSDIIARLGGDEFVVLAMDSDAQRSDTVLQRIQEQSDRHQRLANLPYQLSLSMGVAHSTAAQPCALEELLERADMQMYTDKQRNRAARVVGAADARYLSRASAAGDGQSERH
jgi:diguanylate cyclase (GGDEF)-like protein/PAS domain S-box-containing protein